MEERIMETVGSVAELWRFPVKSMKGEQLREVTITERGVLGDRAYALIDTATGKVASAKSVKLFPDLLACRAAFVEAPRAKREVPPVRIDLPNGRSVTSDSRDVDGALSAYFRRDVTLARVAPDDFTIDQYHPDVEGADPGGNRDTVVAQKLGSALFAVLGMGEPPPISWTPQLARKCDRRVSWASGSGGRGERSRMSSRPRRSSWCEGVTRASRRSP